MLWAFFAFLSAIMYGVGNTIMYQLTTKLGINNVTITILYHIVGIILGYIPGLISLPFGLSKNFWKDYLTLFNPLYLVICAIIGVLMMTGDSFMYKAYPIAPNPGYVDGISNLSILINTMLPVFIYRNSLKTRQIIGIGVVLLAAVLIGYEPKTTEKKTS